MPKSFLVKKTLLAKRRLSQDADHDKDESTEDRDAIRSAFLPRVIASDNGKYAKTNSYPVIHNTPSAFSSSFPGFHHNLDTHGLHTLADLCLRSADYNQPLQISTHTSPIVHSYVTSTDQVKTEAFSRTRDHDLSPVTSDGDAEDKEDQERGGKPIDVVGEDDERSLSTGIKCVNSKRLERLDDELEKMLQGNDEIISREIREFLDNNRTCQKEAARVSTLSQSEITRFLNEGLDIKDEKKTKFYRWYLEKKLGAMDPDDESFTCYKCGKIFAYQNYLERHVKYVCPDKTGRTWKCSYCSKAFQYPCYLRRHMRSHTGESPYKCTQCSRAFVRSTDLQRHLRNHTGEKPYKCKECSRAFARSTDLKRHMRTHTGEKPYKCWQCSKAFSQSGSLQTHLHTHYKESLQIKGVLPESGKAHKTLGLKDNRV